MCNTAYLSNGCGIIRFFCFVGLLGTPCMPQQHYFNFFDMYVGSQKFPNAFCEKFNCCTLYSEALVTPEQYKVYVKKILSMCYICVFVQWLWYNPIFFSMAYGPLACPRTSIFNFLTCMQDPRSFQMRFVGNLITVLCILKHWLFLNSTKYM